jgi:hypothetical protein
MIKRYSSQARHEPVHAALLDILQASLRALVAAGQIETACRLAGQACATLRENSPEAWSAFNAFLHRFARQTPDPQPRSDQARTLTVQCEAPQSPLAR